ncbi:3-deoxy-manno-octulosonate cytidylyltransferase [Ventosimonas gracilis]|uniref:3-deoxy-manno-octulosonate cytidylyltransferase n=1 Tax=Ventosimonas gracilis TaxID=1680762 RepID=A0A139SY05_9GAMM|nr:3-deoxy-manno-octulosonate cytidylyltransferase [Ventosimonas gracilis]KXU39506.1 3-deoxy-manno-octulosonate cytidylyltransferase [Ventosimonas gracilis]
MMVVIPARYASTRLPGKPLLDIAGKPMIERVYQQACQSRAARVLIATDDQRIFSACQRFGAEVLLTSDAHHSGTERLAEVARLLALPDDEIIVNVQGDEPLIPPELIDQVADNLQKNTAASIATLAEPIENVEQLFNPNCVKVSLDAKNFALTFSRAPLPWPRDAFAKSREHLPEDRRWWRHIGIYAYRAKFLQDFTYWGSCELEQCEQLEQLRALWHGAKIHVAQALVSPPSGIDTLEDLQKMRQLLEAA